MRLVEIVTSSMAQNAGILAASAVLSFGNVARAPGVPPDHGLIWYNAGAQVGAQGGAWVGGPPRLQRPPPPAVHCSAVLCGPVLTRPGLAACRAAPPPAAQLATTLIADFVSLCLESKYHSFEFARCYAKSIRRFLAYVLIVVVLGGGRLCVELLLLFCPREYEGVGVLLEQCDKPSVFQVRRRRRRAERRRGQAVVPHTAWSFGRVRGLMVGSC